MRVGKLRIEPQGLPEFDDRPGQASRRLYKRIPQVVVRHREFGIDLQRHPVLGNRLRQIRR